MNDNCKPTPVGRESMFFIVVDHSRELATNALYLLAKYLPAAEGLKLGKALEFGNGGLTDPPPHKVYFTADELARLISALETAATDVEAKMNEQEELLKVLENYTAQLERV